MAGFDRKVYEGLCAGSAPGGAHGHEIQSLRIAQTFDPKEKMFFEEIGVLCIHCGMSLDEIRQQTVVKKTRQKRDKKEPVANDTASA